MSDYEPSETTREELDTHSARWWLPLVQTGAAIARQRKSRCGRLLCNFRISKLKNWKMGRAAV